MIRKLKSEDRKTLENILSNVNQFKQVECDVALELIDMAIMNPGQEDYNVFVFEEDERILGYHCTGQRPLTEGVYDLYWIVVDPRIQGKGIGSRLLQHAEDFVKDKNGRLIIAETSSRDNYNGTRDFYLKHNYSVLAEIKDFYSIEDNLIIFGKYFN